jgi:hypothetical protein
MILNKYPAIMIDTETMPANIAISFGFIICFKITNSGNDKAVVAIIKANAVPIGTPLSISA